MLCTIAMFGVNTTITLVGKSVGYGLATGREVAGRVGGAQAQAKFDAVFGGIEPEEPVSHNLVFRSRQVAPSSKPHPPLRHLRNISWIACAMMRRSAPQSR